MGGKRDMLKGEQFLSGNLAHCGRKLGNTTHLHDFSISP